MIRSHRTAGLCLARVVPVLLLALVSAACDAERLLVDPAPPPGSGASLSISPSTPSASGAAALFSAANLLRVQVVQGNTIVLDTAFSFRPEAGLPSEILLPLSSREIPASLLVEVELRESRLSLLRGNRSLSFDRRQVTVEVEVEVFPTTLSWLSSLQHLSAGLFHSCAVKQDGRAFCWGDNKHGQLGDGTTGIRLTPAAVLGSTRFSQVHAGLVSSCGLGTDRRAYCWGENERGVLGTPTPLRSTQPVAVATEQQFEQLAVGGLHVCGLTQEGRAFCWGFNRYGQLGTGTNLDSPVPVAVSTALRFSKLTAGYLHTCGLALDGRVHCWGWNEYGQLGSGTRSTLRRPRAVTGNLTFRDLSTGGLHTCGLTQDERIFCWGFNEYGQLGNGATREAEVNPVQAAGSARFRMVTVGGAHTCALSLDDEVMCWGYNRSGPLGTGNFADTSQPTPVLNGLRATRVIAGLHHTCAITPERQGMCWGYNHLGQLGDRSTVSSPEPGFVFDEETPPFGLASRNPVYPPALGVLLGVER